MRVVVVEQINAERLNRFVWDRFLVVLCCNSILCRVVIELFKNSPDLHLASLIDEEAKWPQLSSARILEHCSVCKQ